MIIHDLYISGFVFNPLETNSPLIVDADTVLFSTISPKFFESVSGWGTQVLQIFRIIQIEQFAASGSLNVRWQFSGNLALEYLFSFFGCEGFNHK